MCFEGANVAQLVEQLTRNEQVVRSIRIVGSIFKSSRVSLQCICFSSLRAPLAGDSRCRSVLVDALAKGLLAGPEDS